MGATELVNDVVGGAGVVVKDRIGSVGGVTIEGSGRGMNGTGFTPGFLAREGSFLRAKCFIGVDGFGVGNEIADVGGSFEGDFGRGGDKIVRGF